MVRFKQCALVASAAIFSMAVWVQAQTTINFDPQTDAPPGDLPATITAMGNSPGSAVPDSAKLSNQYGSAGVLFSASANYVAVVDVGGSSASEPNGIGGVTSDGLLSYADPITFTFVDPGTTDPATTNDIQIQADDTGIPGQFAKLTAFDINGNVLESDVLDDDGGEVFSIALAGIHTAMFTFPTTDTGAPTTGSAFGSGTGIELDNLRFGPLAPAGSTPPVTPTVPLPPMVWSGLAILAAMAAIQARRQPSTKL
jgi:hypothetical protein